MSVKFIIAAVAISLVAASTTAAQTVTGTTDISVNNTFVTRDNTGTIAAAIFAGSGSGLTNIPAAKLTGSINNIPIGATTANSGAFTTLSVTGTLKDGAASVGAAGQVLSSTGTGTAWSAAGTGSVTSVATGAGLTGGPITTTGTISLDTTHANTWTANQIFGNTNLRVSDTAGNNTTTIKQNSDEAADRILNIPALGGNDTLATLGVANTFTAANTFSNASNSFTGSLNGSVGATTPSTGAFTTLTAPTVNVGSSGVAGTLNIFPSTASRGNVSLTAANNTGNTLTNINVAAQVAARTYTVPDAGASASFVMTEGAQTINGATTFGAAVHFGANTVDGSAIAFTGGSINNVTVGAATANTGAFTTLSASGQLTSTVATGTAPLVVASTTLVPNLSVTGAFIGTQVLTASGTYTPTAGTKTVRIELLGGGGGGGGVLASGGGRAGSGGGGGAGGYLIKTFSGVTGTYTVTVGAGGAGGVNGTNGGNGGSTTFVNGGTTYTAFGGTGGTFMLAVNNAGDNVAGGAGAVVSTNGDINGAGAPGLYGTSVNGANGSSGNGGSTLYGGGGVGISASGAGIAGAGFGAGGSGAFDIINTSRTGGAGKGGVIIIYEYK